MAVPRISLLAASWNSLEFLKETVASVRRQTCRDFEFIIVDDGSTDGTAEWVRSAAVDDPRIRLIVNEENLGHSASLNRGLEECRGEWVARIDADDVALPNRLERQLAFVEEHPTIAVTSCLAYYIDPSGSRIGKTAHDLKTEDDFQRYMQAGEMIGLLHPGAFIRTEALRKVGGYRPKMKAVNDIDLWARIAERFGIILVQQEYLMEYRIHPHAITARFLETRMLYEWCRDCARARRAGRPEPTWEEFLAKWEAAPLLKRVNRSRKIRAKQLYREAGLKFACGRRVSALFSFAGATLLQPTYAIKRARAQMVPGRTRV